MSITGKSSISAVIPAYNEEVYIEKCVLSLEVAVKQIADDFEIIVVDDGSRDRTADILEGLKRSRPYLVLLHHEQNRGLGQALRTGFAKCGKEITFYCDADLPFDYLELATALQEMEAKNATLVTGFRHDRSSEGSLRIVYSVAYNWLVWLLFGLRTKDVNFAFKLIRTEALRKMNLQSDGSFIDAEIMIKADRLGYPICQIGIDYFKRQYGKSTLSSAGTILKIIKEMFSQYPVLSKIKAPDQ
ncbi:MAG: glycosyltransferase family 2 protein [Candidatus Tectomicrobia bacterium]